MFIFQDARRIARHPNVETEVRYDWTPKIHLKHQENLRVYSPNHQLKERFEERLFQVSIGTSYPLARMSGINGGREPYKAILGMGIPLHKPYI